MNVKNFAKDFTYYASTLFNYLVKTLIIGPAGVVATIAVVMMIITATPPAQVVEGGLHELEGVIALGPAPEGYLNQRVCTDKERSSDNTSTLPPEPVSCEKSAVKPVPISDIADDLLKGVFLLYLVAVIVAAAFQGLFVTILSPLVEAAVSIVSEFRRSKKSKAGVSHEVKSERE